MHVQLPTFSREFKDFEKSTWYSLVDFVNIDELYLLNALFGPEISSDQLKKFAAKNIVYIFLPESESCHLVTEADNLLSHIQSIGGHT